MPEESLTIIAVRVRKDQRDWLKGKVNYSEVLRDLIDHSMLEEKLAVPAADLGPSAAIIALTHRIRGLEEKRSAILEDAEYLRAKRELEFIGTLESIKPKIQQAVKDKISYFSLLNSMGLTREEKDAITSRRFKKREVDDRFPAAEFITEIDTILSSRDVSVLQSITRAFASEAAAIEAQIAVERRKIRDLGAQEQR